MAGYLRARRRPRPRLVRRRVSPGVDRGPGRIHRGGLLGQHHAEVQAPVERRRHRQPGCLPPHAVGPQATDPSSVSISRGWMRLRDRGMGSMPRTRPSPIHHSTCTPGVTAHANNTSAPTPDHVADSAREPATCTAHPWSAGSAYVPLCASYWGTYSGSRGSRLVPWNRFLRRASTSSGSASVTLVLDPRTWLSRFNALPPSSWFRFEPIWAVGLDRIVAVSVVDCDQVWVVESGSSMFPARRVVAVDGVKSGFAERDGELPLKI